MKIRNGFVSNSSSTSFVILLPEGFVPDLTTKQAIDAMKEYSYSTQITPEMTMKVYQYLLKQGRYGGDDGNVSSGLLVSILKDYVIAEAWGGPDNGNYVILADAKKVSKIMGK